MTIEWPSNDYELPRMTTSSLPLALCPQLLKGKRSIPLFSEPAVFQFY